MLRKNISKILIPGAYIIAVTVVIASIVVAISGINQYLKEKVDYDYSIDDVFDDTTPVVTEKVSIIKPYVSEKVSIGKYFYDFESGEEEQVKSIIYYENTYMQNSGVDYISSDEFDVVSILDAEVIKVEKDNTLGNIVHLKHDNDLISLYQGVDNLLVKQGDRINQGDIVGTSSKSIINPEYKNAFHFEIYYKGKLIDPENLYSLAVEDLE